MAEERIKRRLAAILVADVVGYSRMMEADEAGTLAALKEQRKTILEPVVDEHGGRIVKLMGDGVLIEFASAVNAVTAALELQKKTTDAHDGVLETRQIVLRIGINLGDVIGEGSDIYGEGVNVAARLEKLAEAGTICVSGKVHDEVRGKVDGHFADLGERKFHNIAAPVRAYSLGPASGEGPPRPALELPNKPSIAVLAFENLSGDPEQEYFADGIVEEIITALSRIRWLLVIARNSSFVYKGRAVDVKQIGRELGVRYVLEGSVRKAGSRLRITGQLIDASTGAHLWADRFDGALEDIFDLQDRVTSSVVGAISPQLEQAEIERAARKPTESLDAYDCYLRGVAALRLMTLDANNEALRMFGRAIEIDPGFASAYGMAARCYGQRKVAGWMSDRARETAEAARLARRATELGRNDAVALCTAGFALAYVVGRVEDGDALIDQALALNGNLAWAWYFSGWVKVYLGDAEMALERTMHALRLSPQDPHIYHMLAAVAYAHFISGRDQDALSWATKALRVQPDYQSAMRIFAASSALTGLQQQAESEMARMRKLHPALRISNLHDLIPLCRQEDLSRLAEGLRRAGLPE